MAFVAFSELHKLTFAHPLRVYDATVSVGELYEIHTPGQFLYPVFFTFYVVEALDFAAKQGVYRNFFYYFIVGKVEIISSRIGINLQLKLVGRSFNIRSGIESDLRKGSRSERKKD